MSYSIPFFIVFCLFFKYSYTLDCPTEPITFDQTHTHFELLSNSSDFPSKSCKYIFNVPKYYVPTILFGSIILAGNNKIVTRQYSEFGGTKSYEITEDGQLVLAPVDFTINTPDKTAKDTFYISITVKDFTPAPTVQTFVVAKDVGKLINSDIILGNLSLLQIFDNENPQAASYSMKIAVFTEGILVYNLMSKVHIYDGGLYKGSLLDVLVAQNGSQDCSGSQFAIVNTNVAPFGEVFTVLIAGKYATEWSKNPIFIQTAVNTNFTQTFTATNGLTVFHEITNPNSGIVTPTVYRNITFRGDGELTIFAGCVTGVQESKRIATITPSTAANYEDLMVYGRCKTYVLTQGVLQWKTDQTFPLDNFRKKIGRKGVIMSYAYPYPNEGDTYNKNYLIQKPEENSKENIIVTYEVAQMSPDVFFQIDQEIEAFKDSNKTLTPSDTTFRSVSTYQQYIVYEVPKGSNGFLVRYTVTSSANFISIGAILCYFSLIYLS